MRVHEVSNKQVLSRSVPSSNRSRVTGLNWGGGARGMFKKSLIGWRYRVKVFPTLYRKFYECDPTNSLIWVELQRTLTVRLRVVLIIAEMGTNFVGRPL